MCSIHPNFPSLKGRNLEIHPFNVQMITIFGLFFLLEWRVIYENILPK